LIASKDLRIGDELLFSNWENAIISSVEVEYYDEPQTTYNFEVADFHTYYVGESGVLCHNTCLDPANQFPPNNGAVPGTEKIIDLQPGTYGRYGTIGETSNYITQAEASQSQLSLPPWNNGIYTEITVLKPIPNVVQSTVAPWAPWGGAGGGMQYMLKDATIIALKNLGYLIY
jgi:hypothetical protein